MPNSEEHPELSRLGYLRMNAALSPLWPSEASSFRRYLDDGITSKNNDSGLAAIRRKHSL